MMLELRPHCECCEYDLRAGSLTRIYCAGSMSCRDCAHSAPEGRYLNCGRELVGQPTQANRLLRHPATTLRKSTRERCAQT